MKEEVDPEDVSKMKISQVEKNKEILSTNGIKQMERIKVFAINNKVPKRAKYRTAS